MSQMKHEVDDNANNRGIQIPIEMVQWFMDHGPPWVAMEYIPGETWVTVDLATGHVYRADNQENDKHVPNETRS